MSPSHAQSDPNRYLDPLPPAGSVYRLSCDQYHAMAEHGIIRDDEPAWLLEGILIWKGAPISDRDDPETAGPGQGDDDPERLPPAGSVYRLSVQQYEAMVEHGILGEDEPVELIEGMVVWKGGQEGGVW